MQRAAHDPPAIPSLNIEKVRREFPILLTKVNGKPLVYLDNGATTQKPLAVIDRITRYYESENANIHRGVYQLSQTATAAYEDARAKVKRFINAADPVEIIFTRGTTEAINLVAYTYARSTLKVGDEIILSHLEHHSNIVPWQIVAEEKGAKIKVIPINERGELRLDEYERMLSPRTKIVAVNHVSNALGTVNDVDKIIQLAHRQGAKVLIDGAQWVAHGATDVQQLDADFYCFSGHKLFGPTGIGILYGKRHLLEEMPPFMGGGDMIESVTFEKTRYAQLPNKFEAGTPDIAGAIGLGAAIDFLIQYDFAAIHKYEQTLLRHATEELSRIPGLRIIGTAENKATVISFVIENPPLSSLDIGTKLDREGIAVRTGHHCCQPIMDRFAISSTTRASFAFYNTLEEVDALAAALRKIVSDAQSRKNSQPPLADQSKAVATDLPFPNASAPSPQAAADELAETFDFLGERDARNQYILELGEKLPHSFDRLKQLTPRIQGCMSEVYLVGKPSSQRLDFIADANSDIVRGLIAVLEKLFAGQAAQDILAFDTESFFLRIGLDQFISTQRRNGLAGMIQRIRALAQNAEK